MEKHREKLKMISQKGKKQDWKRLNKETKKSKEKEEKRKKKRTKMK